MLQFYILQNSTLTEGPVIVENIKTVRQVILHGLMLVSCCIIKIYEYAITGNIMVLLPGFIKICQLVHKLRSGLDRDRERHSNMYNHDNIIILTSLKRLRKVD